MDLKVEYGEFDVGRRKCVRRKTWAERIEVFLAQDEPMMKVEYADFDNARLAVQGLVIARKTFGYAVKIMQRDTTVYLKKG